MKEPNLNFSEEFKKNSNDKEEVRRIIETSRNRCRKFQKIENQLTIDIDWTEKEFYVQNKNGVHGRTKSSSKMKFWTNTDVEGWREMLRSQFAHEYAHIYFFEITGFKYESNIENWRHILLEAHGQHFSEEVYSDIEVPWRTKVSKDKVAERWLEIKPKMSEKIFSHKIIGNREYPLYFGYSTAYYIGKELLKNHDLEDLPELEREEVILAGEKLFGGER